MAKKSASVSVERSKTQPLDDSLLPRTHTILPGESEEDYIRIANQIKQSVNPKDIFEEFWVRDITDLVWNSLRYRRIKGDIVHAATHQGLKKVLTDRMDILFVDSLVEKWLSGDANTSELVDKLLSSVNASMDLVRIESFMLSLPELEKIDRIVSSTDSRRNGILREIDRRRDASIARLARGSTTIVDAEFAEVQSTDKQKPIQNGEQT